MVECGWGCLVGECGGLGDSLGGGYDMLVFVKKLVIW